MLLLKGNMRQIGNTLIRGCLEALRRRLPPGWRVEETTKGHQRGPDFFAKITAPDRRAASLGIEAPAQLDPHRALGLLARLREARVTAPLIVTRYLSPSVRERLREADVSFMDLTGNVRIVIENPGLYVETSGAEKNPDRRQRPARSLRGAKAGRIIRALIDLRDPPGVRVLAARAGVDAGYVSRVLALLETEALITRGERGRIRQVDWVRLLRRWAREAPLESRGRVVSFLEPRGLSALLERLGKSNLRYAVTASLAGAKIAPIAPPRLATTYVTDAHAAAEQLGLRAVDSGANVLLVEVTDDGVFERAEVKEGVTYAAPSQVAADLLTSPGRGPAEGEELISWMMQHEEAWRG